MTSAGPATFSTAPNYMHLQCIEAHTSIMQIKEKYNPGERGQKASTTFQRVSTIESAKVQGLDAQAPVKVLFHKVAGCIYMCASVHTELRYDRCSCWHLIFKCVAEASKLSDSTLRVPGGCLHKE